jgi:hypothetical protein
MAGIASTDEQMIMIIHNLKCSDVPWIGKQRPHSMEGKRRLRHVALHKNSCYAAKQDEVSSCGSDVRNAVAEP